MKHFNTLFDIFLYESIFVFFFGGALSLLEDPNSKILILVAAVSFFIALVLGIAGRALNLFKKDDPDGIF